MGRSGTQYSISLTEIKSFHQRLNITQKQVPKFLRPIQILLDFLTLFHKFFPVIAGFTMVSFYVKSLYTFVPLTETIDIILECVYNRKEISTVLIEDEIKKLLTLCTKNVHFTLNNEIFVPNDGSIFMVEVENTLVPSLNQHVKKWRHYVDDTFAYVKKSIY